MKKMNKIKELPKASSHLLSCTQIITSVQCVIKELLENAIDSSSKSVEIKLEDYGLDKIEVKDCGTGIHKDDIPRVAKPHCTSKITSHLDLYQVTTYGFRGEALAALCALSELLITTKTNEEEFGYIYTFDRNGNVQSTKPFPCTQGTSVTVLNLFKNLPVRKQYYRSEKVKKDELKKIEETLAAFGCIHTGIKFTLYHNKSLIWQKPAVNTVREGLVSVFGNIVVEHMQNCEFTDDQTQVRIEVFLPKGNSPSFCGHSSPSKSIVSINKRPVRMKNINKLLKEYYSKSVPGKYPVCYIIIDVPPSEADINIEPNKTVVMLHNMDVVTAQLAAILKSFYEDDFSSTTDKISKSIHKNTVPEPALKKSDICILSTPTHYVQSHDKMKSNKHPRQTLNHLDTPSTKRTKNHLDTPSTKRTKSFAAAPNDIHRHIKTLETFFHSSDSELSNANTEQSSVVDTPMKVCVQRNTKPTLFTNVEKSCSKENKTITTEHHFSAGTQDTVPLLVTAQEDAAHTITDSNEKVNKYNSSLNTCMPLQVTVHRDPPITNNLGVIADSIVQSEIRVSDAKTERLNKASNNTTESHGIENPFKTKNGSSKTEILEIQNSDIDIHSNFQTMLESIEENSCENFSSGENWSRGKHELKPIAVLRPQTENILPKIKEDVSIIERKKTAFDFFCRKYRIEIAALHPNKNNHQIAQILIEKWNKLSDDEKLVFKDMVKNNYPKPIRNKEKLGKTVSENLNREIEKKRKRKTRKKYVEETLQFNMEDLKFVEESLCLGENVVGSLAPGIWVYSQRDKLHLLNTFRLQEALIYHRLLETFQFRAEPLDSPINTNCLEREDVDLIAELSHNKNISDERITANGFEITLLEGDVEVTGITRSIAFYGIPDLKEILNILREKGTATTLSECRPKKAILYLQSEAVRMSRQCPASKDLDAVKDLLWQSKRLPLDSCLHSRPFTWEVFNLPS